MATPDKKAQKPKSRELSFCLDKLTFSLDEVEELTGLSQHTIRRQCAEGVYEHIRFGGKYSMTMDQIQAMLAKHKRGGDGTPPPARGVDDDLETAREANAARYNRRGAA